MRAQCCICADLFENSGNLNIAAVPCGHTFHEECLMRWLANSSTCPSCRKQVKKNQIIKRLFFDIPEVDDQTPQDPNTLHNQISTLKAQICGLGTVKHELANVQEKLAACVASREEVRDQLKNAEKDNLILERQLKLVTAENQAYHRELKDYTATKIKLTQLEKIQLLLEGAEDDVSEMLKCGRDSGGDPVKQMSSMLMVMKREYAKALEDKKALRNENRDINLQVILAQTKMSEMRKQLRKFQLELEDSNKGMFELERENHKNRRKVAHLRNALKRNKMEGSQSFVAAVNEESPNVAYTPPPPPPPALHPQPFLSKQCQSPLSKQPKLSLYSEFQSGEDKDENLEKSKTNSNRDQKCLSPDLFEQSVVDDNDDDCNENEKDNEANNNNECSSIISKEDRLYEDLNSKKRKFYESAPSVLKVMRFTSAAEKFQAARLKKIESEKDLAPPMPYSNFSIMQKKLTGLSSSRPLTLLKSNAGLPSTRTYNGIGGSCKIEDPFETPFRRISPLLKKKAPKKRCPLASKPIPNQPKIESCLQASSTSTPRTSTLDTSDGNLSSSSGICNNYNAIKKSSPLSLSNSKFKTKKKQTFPTNLFAKPTVVVMKSSARTRMSKSKNVQSTVSLACPDNGVIDLT